MIVNYPREEHHLDMVQNLISLKIGHAVLLRLNTTLNQSFKKARIQGNHLGWAERALLTNRI